MSSILFFPSIKVRIDELPLVTRVIDRGDPHVEVSVKMFETQSELIRAMGESADDPQEITEALSQFDHGFQNEELDIHKIFEGR